MLRFMKIVVLLSHCVRGMCVYIYFKFIYIVSQFSKEHYFVSIVNIDMPHDATINSFTIKLITLLFTAIETFDKFVNHTYK